MASRHTTLGLRPVILLLAVVLLAPSAAAHAEPAESGPAAGARLDQAPDEAWVLFTEPVHEEGTFIRVLDADGERVDEGDLRFEHGDRPTLRVSLPADLPYGAYRIAWQTYSVTDDHTISGSIGFAVGGFAPPSTTTDAEGDLDLVGGSARALVYGGFSLAIGSMAFASVTRSGPGAGARHLHRRMRVGGGTVAAAGGLLLYLDTAHGTGLGPVAFAGASGGASLLGRTALFVALAVAAHFLSRWRRHGTWPLVAGWLAAAWWTASFGHITIHGLWATLLEWTHLVAMAAWVGGLVAFLALLPRMADRQAILALGHAFSRLALTAVIVLATSGSLIMVWLLGPRLLDPAPLFQDSWTWLLAAKIAAFVVVLGLAWINRYVFLAGRPGRFTRPLHAWLQRQASPKRLRRFVAVETALLSGILLVAGALLSVSPPATDGLDDEGMVERTAQGDDHTALLQVRPAPQPGQTATLRFYIQTDPGGDPVAQNTCGRDDCLQVQWHVEGDPDTADEATLVPEGDGWWTAEVLFVSAGDHVVSLDLQTADVFRDEMSFLAVPVESA